MSLREWYGRREILLTGVTSELGTNLLEKLLRSFPDVKLHLIVRSRDGMDQTDRVKKRIYGSPGYERLRQERPDAMDQVEVYEGNLMYDELGLPESNQKALKNVSLVFHAAGSSDKLLEFCGQLPNLQVVVVAGDIFRCKEDQVLESVMDEKLPSGLPLCLVRLPALGPAAREPLPGYVQLLKGPTALMVGAGHMLGRPDLPAEIIPRDIATNTLIAAAWDYGKTSKNVGISVYNAATIQCSWGELIRKGNRASSKFRYPTFRVRGITSSAFLHWIIVLLFEWLPTIVCDTMLYLLGRERRLSTEYSRIRNVLKSFEPMVSRTLTVHRRKIGDIQKCFITQDQESFPLRADIDIEAYILCAAAATRKYCVDEGNLRIVTFFLPTVLALFSSSCFFYYYYLRDYLEK